MKEFYILARDASIIYMLDIIDMCSVIATHAVIHMCVNWAVLVLSYKFSFKPGIYYIYLGE